MVAAALALASAVTVAGCSHEPQDAHGVGAGTGVTSQLLAPGPLGGAPDLGHARRFYPLGVGYHWDWSIHVVNRITTATGTLPPDTSSQPWSAEIVDTARAGPRLYFVQAEYDPRVNLTPPSTGFLMREDRLGLYERDVVAGPNVEVASEPMDRVAAGVAAYVERSTGDAGPRAAFANAAAEVAQKLSIIQLASGLGRRRRTGADPNEITFLSYPLQVGVSWIVRASPRFVRTVVGNELIRVPLGTLTAWRIRGDSELFGPNDRVHYWYSPLGLVRIRFHVEAAAVDSTGAVIGRVATDSDQSLTGVRILRRIDPFLVAGPPR